MLPVMSYDRMLRIHKALHTDVEIFDSVRVESVFSPNKLYRQVSLADKDGRTYKFISQNMRKDSSADTQRVLEALKRKERLSITWIVAENAHGYYGKIESHLTSEVQDVMILDLASQETMYHLHMIRRR